MGVFHAAKALASARRFLRETSPRAVISIGGYAAGPVSLAAAALGVPVVLVEPNSVMGLSNRLLAPLAARIYLAFVEACPRMSGSRARVTGVPLRVGFDARPTGAPTGVRRVLVLGGSQGAQALNERVPDALGRVASELGATTTLQVLHQSGEGKDSAVVEAYARAGLRDARVVAFSTSLPEDLAWADLVIGRAGAGTIAEIAAVGRASVLVPLPSAADDHQAKNAAAYARTGAALWLRQESADATRLAAEISRILRDDARRATMARAARDEGRPEAARTIARDLLQLIEVS
jgi:UDP-N-acetylglucosamine--N-acetylmuramyl-(pentapeptide) pyrophosphoryl-undecaprenol N-acetylglucosamine transferase